MEILARFNSLICKLSLFLVTVLVTTSLSQAQSIFKNKRDIKPIIPTIVPPEAPEIPGEEIEPETTGEETEAEEPMLGEDGKPVVAMPVVTKEMKAEMALNRKRDETANVSSPGIAVLFGERLEELKIIENPTSTIVEAAPGVSGDTGASDSAENADRLESTFLTQQNARTFTFSIPAPRGQILDRNGHPLAQSKVVNYAAIQYPKWGDEPDDTAVLKFAADRIGHVNKILGTKWDLSPKDVRNHYKNRRWMPQLFSGALTKSESEKLGKAQVEGLLLQPVYLRHYPNEKLLSHVIGYVGKRPPRSTAVIGSEEPIWGPGIGVEGLEKSFDKQLTGKPGKISELYDGEGNLIREDTISVPKPGHNIVTSIDIEMQRLVENLLRRRTHRGAMVVMDCNNGDIMAMGSYPQYNPNDFIPSISVEKYNALTQDPEKPLYPRAFRAAYPPASTFKVASAPFVFGSRIYLISGNVSVGPSSWTIGKLTMKNWNSQPERDMNVVSALARSCNTWFYEIAIYVGADTMSNMANRLGLGYKTGLPLPEVDGFIPNNVYWTKNKGHRLSDGDEANMSIGQGEVKTTPVQIARMMAAIGNTENVYNSRLVTQVQDVNHNVVESFAPVVRNKLAVNKYGLGAIRKGMEDVVNHSEGTGKGW